MSETDGFSSQFHKHVNFRDLGGYETVEGRRVRSGLLYRSGGLFLMNEEELALLQKAGIRFVMDLRTKTETDMRPDPAIPGAEMLVHSGLIFRGGEEIDFSPAGMEKTGDKGLRQLALLRAYYRLMPFGNEAFGILFDNIRRRHVPLIFHCHSGKDRTGVAAMLILLALGVPRETVLADYLLSNHYLADDISRELAANREKLLAHPEAEELIRMKTGVLADTGQIVLDEIFTRYPDPSDFFAKEYGVGADELTSLRTYYTEP